MFGLHIALARLYFFWPEADGRCLHNLLIFRKLILDIVPNVFLLLSCQDLMLSCVLLQLIETKQACVFGLLPPGIAQVTSLSQLLGRVQV